MSDTSTSTSKGSDDPNTAAQQKASAAASAALEKQAAADRAEADRLQHNFNLQEINSYHVAPGT